MYSTARHKLLNEISKHLFRLAASTFFIHLFARLVVLRNPPNLGDFLIATIALGLLVSSFGLGRVKHPDPDLQPYTDVSLLVSGVLVLVSSVILLFTRP